MNRQKKDYKQRLWRLRLTKGKFKELVSWDDITSLTLRTRVGIIQGAYLFGIQANMIVDRAERARETCAPQAGPTSDPQLVRPTYVLYVLYHFIFRR